MVFPSCSRRCIAHSALWIMLVVPPTVLVRGEYIHYSNVPLVPGKVQVEVRPIKGSGGEVEMDGFEVTQTAGTTSMAVDLFLFKVSDSCPEYTGTDAVNNEASQACYLQNSGLGVTLTDGSAALCCTQELFNANQCNQVNRAIASPYFKGDHRYISLVPGDTTNPKTTYFGSINEAGQYAMLVVNCDATGTATLNGRIAWESYPGGYEIWENAELELASDVEQMANDCGINVNFFTNGPAGTDEDPTAFMTAVEDYLASLAETCTAAEVDTVNAAFEDFHTCAGFDLQLFIEDLPSALLGTAIECIATMDWDQFQDLDWNDLNEVASIELSPACLDFEFGANAVGFGFRQMALFPDKTLACFKAFSPQVPMCMLEIHPIPILGGLLKPATCLVGEMSSLLDDVLKVEMGAWDKCLPADPKAAGCDNDCLYQGSVLMRGGNMALPVSDTMERLAAADGGRLQSALDRYKLHLSECIDEWSGWTEFDGTTQADRHKVSSSSSSSSSSDSSGGGSRAFFDFAMLIVGLLFGAVLAVIYERVQRKKAFKQTEKQLELTEGTYADQSNDNELI